jgi:acyl carrier protein
MNQQEVLDRLQPVFRDILDDGSLVINTGSSASNVAGWDSLAHINLISTIEHDFKVKFALGELQDLKNVGDLVQLILKKTDARI